jgi:hypothetical protein
MTTRNLTKLLGAGALALALAACGQQETDEYLDYLPAASGLALELQGGAAEGALVVEGEPAEAVAPDGTPNTSTEDLAAGRARLKALNQAVREVFAHVEAVAATGGALEPGDVKVFGPADRCVQPEGAGCAADGTANLRLTVRRLTRGLGTFVLAARPVGVTDDGAFQPVLAGYLAKGAQGRRGAGKLAVNFEHLAAAAAGFTGVGWALAGFHAGPLAKKLTYRMIGFTRDPAVRDPVTATFHGFRTEAGVTRVRLAGIEDLDTSGADTELGFWHLVWHPALGGRSYTVISNYVAPGGAVHGDVPAAPGGGAAYWFGRACYAAGGTTPTYKEWFLCPRGAGPAACVIAAGGVGTPVAGTGTWQTACALATEPPEFALPPGAPATGPDDASEEPGGPGGLAIPGVPVGPEDVNP